MKYLLGGENVCTWHDHMWQCCALVYAFKIKRPHTLGIKICNNSHIFIRMKIEGHILWHAMDKHEKNILKT